MGQDRKEPAVKTLLLISLLALSGCATTRTGSLPPAGAVEMLKQHRQAEAARLAAPEFVLECFRVIRSQEARIKELEVR